MKKDEPAFPQLAEREYGVAQMAGAGLTKREYFAGLALHGILANPALTFWTDERLAEKSCSLADALIAELAKGGDA